MKEKILVFVPIIGRCEDETYKYIIGLFRQDYPHLKEISELTTIDYTKQYVKIILVHIKPLALTNLIDFVFTNTSGRIYRSIVYKPK